MFHVEHFRRTGYNERSEEPSLLFYDGVVIGRMEKMNGEIYELAVPEEDSGARLDLFLAGELSLSRSRARSLIDGGAVSSGQVKKIRPAFKIQPGQIYRVEIP